MTERSAGWTSLTASGAVVAGPSLLWGVVAFSEGQNKQFRVYDGVDSGAGRLVMIGASDQRISIPILFAKPLRMDAGIYVQMDADIDHILVTWEAR